MRPAALLLAAALLPASALAQRPGQQPRPATPSQRPDSAHTPEAAPAGPGPRPDRVTTQHAATIGGQRIEYDATVGDVLLRNDSDQVVAQVYYTAYTRRGVQDLSHRPITFAYNGGPGSSSVWLHMGALGPRRVSIPDTTHAPPPPYQLVDNQYSPLDKTDLVFIDPVGTGYSMATGKGKGSDFWGVDQDARSLAQFVSRYLSENSRWNSPRYLLGESYGTTRSAALGALLQSRWNIDLNGIMLLSAVLDFQTITFDAGNDMPYILYLPSYAAVAWYHNALANRAAQLRPFLQEVERFAMTDYAQALLAGGTLAAADRARIVDRLAQYTGLSKDYLEKADLRVDAPEFEKELLREHGEVVGRLDARFTGATGDPLAQRAPYDPQSSDISSAYTSALNQYMHEELNFGRDKMYTISGNVNPWDWRHGAQRGWPGHTNVAVDLAEAIQENPRLHVQLNSGLFDLATPYYAAEWTMDHLGLSPEQRKQIEEVEYDAGHMVYVHEASLARFKQSIASFIDHTTGGGQ
jgi:carboxypeptidase C (cathepsin A)